MLPKYRMKVLFFLILCCYSPFNWAERLILSLGEKTWLPLPADPKIRIGDKSLLSIQIDPMGLFLLARKTGQTLLISGNKQYEVFILQKEKKRQALMLDQNVKDFWGLDWSLSAQMIFQVTGTLNRLSDWIDLAKVSKAYNIHYEFKARPGEGLEKTIQYYFNQLFKNQNPPEIVWQKGPLTYIPQGASVLEYEPLLQPFGLSLKEDPLWLSTAPFIEIEIALVESLSSSGLSFGGTTDSLLFRFSSLLAFLNFLKSSGQGKSLHHSSIIGQSGQKLHIQSGGQIPFNSYNLKTEQKSIQWKSYGLDLNLTPKVGKKNQIELKIKAQISEPMAFASTDRPSPLKTQSLENTVILKEGQILPLFQLKKQSQGMQNQSHLAVLSDFPGSFLRGKNQYKMTQFIFIQAKRKK